MNKFIKALEEKGIKDSIMKVLEKNPDADIAEILEYEISKDENLEDAFLEEAHECAVNAVCGEIFNEFITEKIFNPEKVNALGEALAKASEQIIDAFISAVSGLFDDKN